MSKRILQISPFGIENPRHGGQIRANRIRATLLDAGLDLHSLQIFRKSNNQKEWPDIDVDASTEIAKHPHAWQLDDFDTGPLISEDEACFSAFCDIVDTLDIGVIILEEPWLWPPVKRYLAQRSRTIKLVYSSYNVESIAKRRILVEAGYSDAEGMADEIAAMEAELSSRADLCIVTTLEDMRHYSAFNSNVLLAPNGTVRRNEARVRGVRHHLIDPSFDYALFVGSGHPPNIDGLLDFVLPNLWQLRSDERVVVAGTVCRGLVGAGDRLSIPFMFRERLIQLDAVEDFGIDALIANASIILLPIAYGGGSNLKTAEALVSSKKIVGTSVAFRGFEQFQRRSGIWIADTAERFGESLRSAFSEPKNVFERRGTETLLWQSTLSEIPGRIRQLLKRN